MVDVIGGGKRLPVAFTPAENRIVYHLPRQRLQVLCGYLASPPPPKTINFENLKLKQLIVHSLINQQNEVELHILHRLNLLTNKGANTLCKFFQPP